MQTKQKMARLMSKLRLEMPIVQLDMQEYNTPS